MILLVFITCSVFSTTAGISCVECIAARSEQECQERGIIKQCDKDQVACEIEIREHEGWGGYLFITKQCKQFSACDNNHVQNPRAAWWPTQCNIGKRNSVCRCCCYSDLCNIDKGGCFGEIKCPNPPSQLHNGGVLCSNGRLPGSRCSSTCNRRTKMVGSPTTLCSSTGYWSDPFPRCADIECKQLVEIHNGWYSCSRGNFASSVCRAQCQRGFILYGFIKTVCTMRGLWSNNPTPLCAPITCPELPPVTGGTTECSEGRNVQSRCRITCDADRTRKGFDEIHCQENGEWSHEPLKCQEIKCPRRRRILFGSGFCTKSTKANSTCRYKCNKGFILKGNPTSNCQLIGEWDRPIPICTRIMCPPRGYLAFGRVRCTFGPFTGSVCRSQCNAGSILVGDVESECTPEGKWTAPLPLCETCEKLPLYFHFGLDLDEIRLLRVISTPQRGNLASLAPRLGKECSPRGTVNNGSVRCTDGNFAGSRCTVSCLRGRRVVGASTSTCLESEEWSDPLSTCQRNMCPRVDSIEGGSVRCTNEHLKGSRCTVTCDSDRILSGAIHSTCLESGKWNPPFADCKRLECPSRGTILGGKIQCTDQNFVESECTVTCDPGKKLSGTASTNCMLSKKWDAPLASCLDMKCPQRGSVTGGEIVCTNLNLVGSICTVICEAGRILIGSQSSSCGESETWNVPLPICERIVCTERGLVDNGVVECDDSFYQGTKCNVNCFENYEPIGTPTSTCLETGEWDYELPFCRKRTCEPRGNILFGFVTCSDENNRNSVCTASCAEGYTLVGASETECLPSFKWSDDLPVCEETTCSLRDEVEHGTVYCDDGQRVDSVCSVICDFSARLIGAGTSECQSNGKWSYPLPNCEIMTCDDQGELKYGKITCTGGNRVRSICSFECLEKNYELYPAGRDRNVCQRSMRWSIPKPCCSRSCPPYALVDIVVVLDSSSSIGAENWVMLTSFVEGILRSFIVDDTSVNFAIFRFNNVVDEKSQIFLNSHSDSIEGLIRSFNKFEYGGSGTKTGNALNHALTVSLAPEHGNRPDVNDVVLVITDGAASDDVVTPSEALREMGATLLVLGIQPPRGNLDLAQLRDIAASDENLMIAATGFSGLTKEFGVTLSRTICGEPCA